MNNFTEQDRIEQFKKTMKYCMPNRFPEGFIDTLKEKGFFTAPASIHHHGAYSGALFDHSLAVANSLLSLTKRLELKWQDGRSPLIVGMFHDFCKVDNYTKTDNEAWEYNNATLLPGHGDKSVIMLQQYMQLTEEEMLCIRWHMGAFDDKENWNSYGGSNQFPECALYTYRRYDCRPYFRRLRKEGAAMNKFYNGIMGLVVGDALGVPVEFRKRDTFIITDMTGYGTYNQPPGTWSDDSSLTLATLDSMAKLGKIDPADIMQNFFYWLNDGMFTPYGEVFDVGGGTRRAIARFANGKDAAKCGGKTRMDNGNGALMRILPVAMLPDYPEKEADLLSVAHLTHAHFISDFACRIYAAVVENLMNGMKKEEAVFSGIEKFKGQIESVSMLSDFGKLIDLEWLERTFVKSSGYVVDTLEAALWCFLNTNTYRDCVLTAVNLGEDTDTVAAVAGGLAGIYYGCGGESGVPDEWIAQIPRRDWIKGLCAELIFEN